jgi:tetratricopeptide (TPR) repeat protein
MTHFTHTARALVTIAILGLAGAAAAQQTISAGSTTRGALTEGDPRDAEGRHYDVYVLRARTGQRFRITMTGEMPFDPLLQISGPNVSLENDDDSGLNSALELTAPSDGNYQIRATTYEAGMVGAYALAVTPLSGASQAQTPAPTQRTQNTQPGAPGQLPNMDDLPPEVWANMPDEVLAQLPPEWRARAMQARQAAAVAARGTAIAVGTPARAVLIRSEDIYSVTLRAGQQVHVTVTSDVFDTHLKIEGPNGFEDDNNNQYGEMYGAERNYRTDIQDSAIYLIPPVAGDYRIIVTNNEEDEQSGAYTLGVAELPRFSVGRDFSGELTSTDRKNFSDAFMDVFAYTGRAGETLNILMTTADFPPILSIVGPNGYSENTYGGDAELRATTLELTLPASGEYRIGFQAWRPQDVGSYRVQSSRGALAQAAQPRTTAARLPSDCNAAKRELDQQLVRIGLARGLQYSEVMMQRARAHLCLDNLAAADADYAAVVQANGGGSPDWTDAILSRIALAEMRGDTAGAQTLRTYMTRNIGLGGLRYGGRFEQYGHENYIIDPVDNLALLEFALMMELARGQPDQGVAILGARYQTIQGSGRRELAARVASLYTGYTSQAAAGVTDCNALLQMGVSYTLAGNAESGATTIRRALTDGRRYTERDGPRDFFCGNWRTGRGNNAGPVMMSGDVIDEGDVVLALAKSLIVAGQAREALTVLQEWSTIEPGDHHAAAATGSAYEVAGDAPRALEAWRNAMRVGANRFRNFEGGSIHEEAGDAFIRLGSPGDAAAAFERYGRIMQGFMEQNPNEEAEPWINSLFAQAAVSARLAAGNTREPLGCPTRRGAVDVSSYGITARTELGYESRAYFAYCQAWARQAGDTPDARRTLSQLLEFAQQRGADEVEVQRLVESSLEAAWASGGQ